MPVEKYVIFHFAQRRKEYTQRHETSNLTKLIPKYSGGKPARVLELGCGDALRLHQIFLQHPNFDVVGLDITKALLHEAKILKRRVSLLNGTAERLPLRKQLFSIYIFENLLHHLVGISQGECIKKIMRVFQELKRTSKQNSLVFIYELCIFQQVFSKIIFFLTFLLAQLNISIPSLDIHDKLVLSFLTPNKLTQILRKSGIRILKINVSAHSIYRVRFYRLTLVGALQNSG